MEDTILHKNNEIQYDINKQENDVIKNNILYKCHDMQNHDVIKEEPHDVIKEEPHVECPICYDKIEFRCSNDEKIDNTSIKLDCNHTFHYNCILMTFKTNLINNRKVRRCPFCRKVTSHIPLIKQMFPLRNIHKEYEVIKDFLHSHDFQSIYVLAKEYNFLDKSKCHAIVTTGNNRGSQCKKNKSKDGSVFCYLHKKNFSKYII